MFEWDSNIKYTQNYDHNSTTCVRVRAASDSVATGFVATGDKLYMLSAGASDWMRAALDERAGSIYLTAVVECGPH